MIIQEIDIIKVVIITVCLRPILSPIYPKIRAPNGLKTKVEQNEKAVKCYINAISLNPNDQESRDAMNLILETIFVLSCSNCFFFIFLQIVTHR